MATHPSVQQKAHEEIDRVIGTKRLPQFSDRNSGRMPYIEAIYRELLRITQPMPLSIPHSVSQDDHFKGYFIPKGWYYNWNSTIYTRSLPLLYLAEFFSRNNRFCECLVSFLDNLFSICSSDFVEADHNVK